MSPKAQRSPDMALTRATRIGFSCVGPVSQARLNSSVLPRLVVDSAGLDAISTSELFRPSGRTVPVAGSETGQCLSNFEAQLRLEKKA